MSSSVNITVCGLRWETRVSTGMAREAPKERGHSHPWWRTAAQVSWADHSPVMAGATEVVGAEVWDTASGLLPLKDLPQHSLSAAVRGGSAVTVGAHC